MSGLGLVGGVVAVDAVLLTAGFGVLAPSLRGVAVRTRVTYAGLAFLAGAGVVGLELCLLVLAGVRATPVALLACAAVSGTAGVGVARLRSGWVEDLAASPRDAAAPDSSLALLVSTGAGFVLAAVGVIALVGGFRSSPWLDDTWTMWVPKGIALDRLGLDGRLFLESHAYVALPHLDYPWWWSILVGNDLHVVGTVDLRAVNGQLTILLVAFVAAAARLLWGYVRPQVLLPGLVLVACSPELLRQIQGGGADVPLAAYLVLFALGASLWLLDGRGFGLLVAGLGAAVALQVKTEGLPQVLLFAAVLSLFGVGAGRRRLGFLWATVAVAFATAAPFLIWRRVHGLRNDISYGNAFDPGFLFGRTGRVGTAAGTIARHLVTPREWLFLVPLALLLGLVGFARARDARWLAPTGIVAAGFGFWVWVNWADVYPLSYRLPTSSYRIVDAVVLAAGVAVPVLTERLLVLWHTVSALPQPEDVAPGVARGAD